jgi:hypothetical protein
VRYLGELSKEPAMFSTVVIQPMAALLIGILILIVPRLLSTLIAVYLIFIGLVGLFPNLLTSLHLH